MRIATVKFEDCENLALSDLKQRLESTQKPRVGELTLDELASCLTHPNGVYAFYDSVSKNQCVYVGVASSRSFISRVASHFEPGIGYWMNHLPKKLMAVDPANRGYEAALADALGMSLVLIGYRSLPASAEKSRAPQLRALESVLRSYLAPKLNATKPIFNGSELVLSAVARVLTK